MAEEIINISLDAYNDPVFLIQSGVFLLLPALSALQYRNVNPGDEID